MSQDVNNNVEFISVADFKAQTGTNTLEVKRNQKTGKLFVALPGGKTMRCQQDFDSRKPYQFIVDQGADITEGCLINYDASKGAELIATL